jgi:hypothetical protein
MKNMTFDESDLAELLQCAERLGKLDEIEKLLLQAERARATYEIACKLEEQFKKPVPVVGRTAQEWREYILERTNQVRKTLKEGLRDAENSRVDSRIKTRRSGRLSSILGCFLRRNNLSRALRALTR